MNYNTDWTVENPVLSEIGLILEKIVLYEGKIFISISPFFHQINTITHNNYILFTI